MKIGFHGTSIQAATSIMKNGWKIPVNGRNWTLSTGNPYVLTDKDKDKWDECFEVAMTQSSSKALKENHINKRAVIAFDLGTKPLKKDDHHHKDYAYEVQDGFYSWDVMAIWCDEWDISEFQVFADFQMKRIPTFIPSYTYRSPIQLAITKALRSYSMDKVEAPIKEMYRKNSRFFSWNPNKTEYGI